jgi:hypothetical protein
MRCVMTTFEQAGLRKIHPRSIDVANDRAGRGAKPRDLRRGRSTGEDRVDDPVALI